MKTRLFVILLFGIVVMPSLSFSQSNTDAIIAGKNIAVAETESGKVRGYIH